MVTERVCSETLAAVQSSSPLRAFTRKDERVTIGHGAGNSENGVKTLEHYGTQHHLAQVRLHGQISQVVAQICQVFLVVQSSYFLSKQEWALVQIQ